MNTRIIPVTAAVFLFILLLLNPAQSSAYVYRDPMLIPSPSLKLVPFFGSAGCGHSLHSLRVEGIT